MLYINLQLDFFHMISLESLQFNIYGFTLFNFGITVCSKDYYNVSNHSPLNVPSSCFQLVFLPVQTTLNKYPYSYILKHLRFCSL